MLTPIWTLASAVKRKIEGEDGVLKEKSEWEGGKEQK